MAGSAGGSIAHYVAARGGEHGSLDPLSNPFSARGCGEGQGRRVLAVYLPRGSPGLDDPLSNPLLGNHRQRCRLRQELGMYLGGEKSWLFTTTLLVLQRDENDDGGGLIDAGIQGLRADRGAKGRGGPAARVRGVEGVWEDHTAQSCYRVLS
uniref:Uncharacterized protein n=1 Tax=Oryza brachyantha TaxID=4533 RepID=J3LBZ9_ORYBR